MAKKSKLGISRTAKSEIKTGETCTFKSFPYKFISYLNLKKFPYELICTGDYNVTIVGEARLPLREIIRRKAKEVVRREEFEPEYVLTVKNREKNPELFAQLKRLRKKFITKNRKTSVPCPNANKHFRSIEVCLTRCADQCSELTVDRLVGPYDDRADFYKDLIQYQHIANIIYGSMREIDHFTDGPVPAKVEEEKEEEK